MAVYNRSLNITEGPTILVKRLWRQLVVTCTAFGVRSTEKRHFERALELFKRAEILLSRYVQSKNNGKFSVVGRRSGGDVGLQFLIKLHA